MKLTKLSIRDVCKHKPVQIPLQAEHLAHMAHNIDHLETEVVERSRQESRMIHTVVHT